MDDLEPNTRYVVSISSEILPGRETSGSPWSFEFETGTEREFPLPVISDRPVISEPSHLESLEYVLVWEGVEGAIEYQIQESRGDLFTYSDREFLSSDKFITIKVNRGNEYYYRVRARLPEGYSSWSPIYFVRAQN